MVLSIQTLCCGHSWYLTQVLSISSDSSLRWFYTFIWVQLCLIITDWTWLGKPHTVYIRPYSSQCMSGQMRIMRSKELPEELRDRIVARHRSGQGYKKNSAALKVPKSTVASIILKWKTLGQPEPYLELAVGQTELSGEREVKKNPKITVAELQRSIRRWEKVVESQPSLQPSTSRGFMAEWPDRSLSSVQDTWKPAWSLLKNTWRTPRWWQIRFSGLMRPRYNFLALILSGMCGENQALLITCPIQSQQWSMVVAASCCGGVFQLQGQDNWCNRGKDECGQVQGYPGRKTFSRVLRTSDWAEGLPSNKTMTLSTQLK